MKDYHKILLLLEELLRRAGDTHWQKHIAQDIKEWETRGYTRCFRGHFGGMGSINDMSVAPLEGIGNWSNNLFDILKSMGYEFARSKTINFDYSYSKIVNGSVCGNCSYAEIGEPEIEYFLSRTFLPAYITSLLPGENYLSLLDVEGLSASKQVCALRDQIIASIVSNGIVFKSKIEIFGKGCPKCSKSDIGAYRWNVVTVDSIAHLKRSPDNLRVKADGPSWWRKFFFGER